MKIIKSKFEKYDPSWIVEASEKLKDEYPWLPYALKKCTRVVKKSKYYIYFVNPKNPNKLNSEWQFDENILIEDTVHGDIVLDILKGERVGGIEFYSKLLK